MQISDVTQNTRRVRALISANDVTAMLVAAVIREAGLPPDAKVEAFELIPTLGHGHRAEVVLVAHAK